MTHTPEHIEALLNAQPGEVIPPMLVAVRKLRKAGRIAWAGQPKRKAVNGLCLFTCWAVDGKRVTDREIFEAAEEPWSMDLTHTLKRGRKRREAV